MAPYSAKNLYFCAMFVASLALITSGLNLEDLSLEIQQLRQNVQYLEEKVQHLETKLIEQDTGRRQMSYINVNSAVQKRKNLIGKQLNKMNAIFRTCRELREADPFLDSGMYWIDPDGRGVGDDPIYVHCDMTTGTTAVPHDSEDPTDVGHCADPGCYSRRINYTASYRQMLTLADLSSECHQSIKYDCINAPLELNGIAQSWWYDRYSSEKYFWSGIFSSVHTCQCGIDQNCVEPSKLCNCDSALSVPLNDTGIITDKTLLPILRLFFGHTQSADSSGIHTLGRFECSGEVTVYGWPKSCHDLWIIGYSLNGFYSIMGSQSIETVYCNFEVLPNDSGFQRWIGYSGVTSWPIHFYAQKNTPQVFTGQIKFEYIKFNAGGGMNSNTGTFTAPVSGVYSFSFSGVSKHPASNSTSYIIVDLELNTNPVARAQVETNEDNSFHTLSLQSTLQLKANDFVWLRVRSLGANAELFDSADHLTHFTGSLLQEYLFS